MWGEVTWLLCWLPIRSRIVFKILLLTYKKLIAPCYSGRPVTCWGEMDYGIHSCVNSTQVKSDAFLEKSRSRYFILGVGIEGRESIPAAFWWPWISHRTCIQRQPFKLSITPSLLSPKLWGDSFSVQFKKTFHFLRRYQSITTLFLTIFWNFLAIFLNIHYTHILPALLLIYSAAQECGFHHSEPSVKSWTHVYNCHTEKLKPGTVLTWVASQQRVYLTQSITNYLWPLV